MRGNPKQGTHGFDRRSTAPAIAVIEASAESGRACEQGKEFGTNPVDACLNALLQHIAVEGDTGRPRVRGWLTTSGSHLDLHSFIAVRIALRHARRRPHPSQSRLQASDAQPTTRAILGSESMCTAAASSPFRLPNVYMLMAKSAQKISKA